MVGLDILGLWDRLSKLGFAGLLFFILVGFQQGWWFFGRERTELKNSLDAMTKDRDEWRARYLAVLQVGERAVTTTERATGALEALRT